MRAVADGSIISLITLTRPTSRWPGEQFEQAARPVVVLVGDDPAPEVGAVGPHGWECAKRIKYWCRAAVVHGAASQPDHYRLAVLKAVA